MKKRDGMDRREFLGKAALAALAVPALVKAGSTASSAQSGPASGASKEDAKKIKKVSVEEHWGNKQLVDIRNQWYVRTGTPAYNDPKVNPNVFPMVMDIEKWRIPAMDEWGIAMQILSTSSPAIQGIVDTATAVATAKKINDEMAELMRKYPGRFAGLACVPTQDPKAAADELERAVKQLGYKGTMIQGHTNGEYLDEKKFWVLWERAEALGVPIYLHVTEPSREARKIYDGHPELLGPIWSWGVEAATHTLRIVGGGVFDAFPKATLILGHLGESLPFLLGRLDEGYAMVFKPVKLKKDFSAYIKENIMVATSGKYRPEALVCTISAMGADRVLFAADYPWVSPKDSVELVERTPMSDADREKIYYRNAERVFKL
jgi:2,3-dihydroxybenzoate decarboxylase